MTITAFSRRSILSVLWPVLSTALLAFPIFVMQSDVASLRQSHQSESVDFVVVAGESLPSFGFRNIIADFYWLQFLQYYGDNKARSRSGYRFSYDYLKAITDRDPHFDTAYLFVNLAVTYQMGRPDLSEKLFLKGIASNPNSYQIWQARGFLHFLYTGDLKKAAYAFRRNAGLAVAQEGNAKQRWANYWIGIAKAIEVPDIDTRYTRRKIWEEIYANTSDKQVKKMALVHLKPLGAVALPDGSLQEIFSLPSPKGFAKRFTYGPPSPKILRMR
jgi:tetratricopeptide (TPR) repeat protein